MAAEAPIAHNIDWPVVSLSEIVTKIGSGATPTGGAETYLPKRVRFALIRSQNVFDRYFDHDGLAFISDQQAAGLRGVALLPGDILLNITGDGITFGRACQVPDDVLPACVNQHVSIIRVDPRRADPGYVLSFLVHPEVKPYIESFNAGGSRRAITKGHIESFRLPLPPLADQQAIARVLSTLDKKIELNRRMSGTLDSTTRALFRSWFVDAALSDPGFKDWKREPLRAHIVVERGLSYGGDGLREDGTGLPMNNLNSIYEGGGYKFDGIKYYDGDYRDRHLTSPGDIVMANTEQGFDLLLIGHAAIVPKTFGNRTLFSHHTYRIRPRPTSYLTAEYLVHFFNDSKWHRLIAGFSNGTTVNMLPIDALEMPVIPVPPKNRVDSFTTFAEAAGRHIEGNVEQSHTLATLRDALLPKLVSGEIRVREAEAAVEAVL